MRANVASPTGKANLTVVETGEAAVLRHLGTRRSASAAALTEPGPDRAALESMLTIAARVPDHKKLAPWRFIVIEGEARARFGALLAQTCAANEPAASDARHEIEHGRFLRAPVVVAVVSSPVYHPAAPEWEQVLSAGAVCLNLLHAASAYGFGAQWISEWYAYDEQAKRGFGLKDGERIAGFIYIGTAREKPTERDRPELSAITSFPEGPQE
jgi:nitroreductase